MRKIIFRLIVFSIFVFIVSCGKRYDEDPITMKLYSIKSRIIGNWQLNKVLVDGNDLSSILFNDSLKIFSFYNFIDINKANYGHVSISSLNNAIKIDNIYFGIVPSSDKNHIIFTLGKSEYDTLLNNKIIIPYGPIDEFGQEHHWLILKLTLKEMHLSILEYSHRYELFFKYLRN